MISPDLRGDETQKNTDLRDILSSHGKKQTQSVVQAIPRHSVVHTLINHLPKKHY